MATHDSPNILRPAGSFDTPIKALATVADTLTRVFEKVTGMTLGLAKSLVNFQLAFATALPSMERFNKTFEKISESMVPFNKSITAFAGMSDKVTAPFKAMVTGLESVAAPLKVFVGALNPGLVQLLELALRDLTAVVGQAFGPALMQVIELIQEVAAAFMPIMQALAPVFEDLFDAISDLISNQLKVLKPILEMMAPLFQLITEALRGVTLAMVPLMALFKGIIAALAPLISTVLQGLVPIFQQLARATVLAITALYRFAGMTELIKDMANMIDPNKEKERERVQGFAAVQNVQITDAQNYGKQMLTNAASAGMGLTDKKKSSDEWLEQLAKEVKEVGDGNFQAFEKMQKDILDALSKLGDKIVTAVKGEVYDKGKKVLPFLGGGVGLLSMFAGARGENNGG